MKTQTKQTKVIFRMFQGEVLALFPAEASTVGQPQFCSSYAHIGQHSAADPIGVITDSRPASPDEYAPLKRELEQIGYTLDVKQRTSRTDYLSRKAQLSL